MSTLSLNKSVSESLIHYMHIASSGLFSDHLQMTFRSGVSRVGVTFILVFYEFPQRPSQLRGKCIYASHYVENIEKFLNDQSAVIKTLEEMVETIIKKMFEFTPSNL